MYRQKFETALRSFLRPMAFLRPAVITLGLLAIGGVVMNGSPMSGKAADPDDSTSPKEPSGEAKFLPTLKIAGHAQCVDCHRAEVTAWRKSAHSGKVFDLLLDASAVGYAKKMGIEIEQMTRDSLCLDCHATPATDRRGHPKPLASVSCEACHNPAGGESGWLNLHAVYGGVGTRRDAETPEHHAKRAERCREAGQIRSTDLYQMAQRCLACHIVGNEKLVDTAGHKLGGDRFEMLKKMSGEIRHNFHVNQKENAQVASLWIDRPRRSIEARMAAVYVVGQLAKSETVLRHLAAAEDPEGDYAADLAVLFEQTLDNLEDTEVEALADLADDHRDLCDRLLDGDFDQGDKEVSEAADQFGTLAKKYAEDDRDNLKDSDALKEIELPNIEDDLKKSHQP